jgi:hypothetical protein
MGCDIHVYTEKLNSNNHWVNVDHWQLDEYYTEYSHSEDDDPYGPNTHRWSLCPVYRGRDYELFSTLAGVRKGFGAGPQFSEPRGLPDDVSDMVRSESDRWDGDGHSHSYATLWELVQWKSQHPKSHTLDQFLSCLKNRCADELWTVPNKLTPEQLAQFRVVFWFDN